jgi:hypothetical protein
MPRARSCLILQIYLLIMTYCEHGSHTLFVFVFWLAPHRTWFSDDSELHSLPPCMPRARSCLILQIYVLIMTCCEPGSRMLSIFVFSLAPRWAWFGDDSELHSLSTLMPHARSCLILQIYLLIMTYCEPGGPTLPAFDL